jgi:hypothetical protein
MLPPAVLNFQLKRLFLTGATLGPLIDSIHNSVLLKYDILPVEIMTSQFAVRSSLLIPPLLGLTYAVLGGIIPLLGDMILRRKSIVSNDTTATISSVGASGYDLTAQRVNAFLAVLSTAFIIKLSSDFTIGDPTFLDNIDENASFFLSESISKHYGQIILYLLAFLQWALLEKRWTSLLLALTISIAGPLAEIPFISSGAWHYLNPDYFPLGNDWPGLSSITGPCYFAVTTDAIALGRAFLTDGYRKTPPTRE